MKSCISSNPTIVPLRLDDGHLAYVEQQTVTPQRDGRVLVAGVPTFIWDSGGPGYDPIRRDSVLGVILAPPRTAKALVSPFPGRSLSDVRSAAMSDGWWLVSFAEVVPAPVPQDPKLIALWSGETDGTVWRSLVRLPAVADSLVPYWTSALVLRGSRALLAVPSIRGGQRRVVFFVREGGQWTATSNNVGARSYVALGATASRDVLAVVRPDTTETEDSNSLFVYTKAPQDSIWSDGQRIVRAFRTPVHDPALDSDRDGLLLSWQSSGAEGQSPTAWFTALDAQGKQTAANLPLAANAKLVLHASQSGHSVWAVTNSSVENPLTQLIEYDGLHVSTAYLSAMKYRGLLGLTITREFLVVIASSPSGSSREPPVISVIQSHQWRCQ